MTSYDKCNLSPTGDIDQQQELIPEYETLGLKTFVFTEHKGCDMENDIDPENNFYIDTQSHCEYYTEEQFNRNLKTNGIISIIHFNSTSLNSNLSKIKHCLTQLNRQFTAISISETWLNEEQTAMVDLEGYEMYFTNRNKKKGGGVALYINKNYKSKFIKSMSQVVDNIMECTTVEIEIEKSKNILMSFVYRTPGSCIDTFRDKL